LNTIRLTEHRHGTVDLDAEILDYPSEMARIIILFANVVHDYGPYACVDVVADVVERDRERVNIFAVKWRDERLVELVSDLVGKFVARVLDGLDPRSKFAQIALRVEHLGEDRRSFLDLSGHLRKEVEIHVFTRQ
jgi:hypothetical protein